MTGRLLYVAWNLHLRLVGPFVLPSASRRRQLAALHEPIERIRSLPGIRGVRCFQTSFVVPLRDGPRFDVILMVDGDDDAVQLARKAIEQPGIPEPAFASYARNVQRFGDTDAADGPILLNHFTSSRSVEEVARVWTGISTWYGEALDVDNSTLLALDDSSRYVAINYAGVPGPVVWFLADQLLRPSFRSSVTGPLASVDARALPLFARRTKPNR